ncbi:hypothetical protein [Lentibacillus daqui]|nr:hypothetical protein [Lentibacillus daqui]
MWKKLGMDHNPDIQRLSVTYSKTSATETRPVVIYDFENDCSVIASL